MILTFNCFASIKLKSLEPMVPQFQFGLWIHGTSFYIIVLINNRLDILTDSYSGTNSELRAD